MMILHMKAMELTAYSYLLFVSDLNKGEIFNSTNSQYFFAKISGIGSWVSKIVTLSIFYFIRYL